MRHVILFLLFTVTAVLATPRDVAVIWRTADKSVILELWNDGEAGYVRGEWSGNGTWRMETEGKYAGAVRVDLNSIKRTKFTLYFQPDGKRLLGINTLTVDGIQIPDDTLFTSEG